MKNYILLIIFLFSTKAYSQNCCGAINASADTVICKDSVQLHAMLQNEAIISCTTLGDPQTQNEYDETQFTINGSLSAGDVSGCGQGPKLIIAVIDSVCLLAWTNNNANFGQLNQYPLGNCLPHAENDFQFSFNNPPQMDSAVSMLTNRIPQNDYVLVYTFENIDLSQYPQLVSALSSLGSNLISSLGDVPYIFLVKKGFPSTMLEKSGVTNTDTITLNATLTSSISISNMVFSWSPGGTLNDSTIQSPKALPDDTTKYYVTATDTVLRCNTIDSVTVPYNCATGIQENTISDEVNIFPNPTTDYLIIKSNSLKLKRIFLINTLGQLISQTEAANSSSQRIDASNIAEGVYCLKIETDKGILNRKIIVISK